jgi:hypothetical protein
MFRLLYLRFKNQWYLLDWLWVGLDRIDYVGTISATSLLKLLMVLTDCSVGVLSRLQAH